MSAFYIAGGTLSSDASCYVERQADQQLYRGLLRGEFCYVLTARQMGKSSLMIRTVKRLREAGTTAAVLDLTAVGQNLTPEQWYRGLLQQLGQRLNLDERLGAYWRARSFFGLLQRWIASIREVVLPNCSGNVVVFVDEIDMVRSLPFSVDEFFAGIRQCYNERAQHAEMGRLSFCLLGVATPTDLVRDTRMTPFNIGNRIQLEDFTRTEAAPLAAGLHGRNRRGESLLWRVLHWTSGHPYLTQRLCLELAKDPKIGTHGDVDKLCSRLFLSPRAQTSDDNLLFVRERLLHSDADLAALLDLYGRIHRGRRVPDEQADPLVSTLQLAGVTRAEQEQLKVRNRIYFQVFDQRWIEGAQPDAEKRRQRTAYRRGLLRATLIAALILAIVSGLAVMTWRQRFKTAQEAEANRRLLYDRQMGIAQQEWEAANVDRVNELLQETIPKPEQLDLRGFEWYQLWRETHPDAPRRKEEYPIIALSLGPSGGSLVAAELLASREKTNILLLKIFDLRSKSELRSFQIPYDTGFDLIGFMPDARQAVIADPYSDSPGGLATATLWDLISGRPVRSFRGHPARLSSLAISSDGKQLATADTNGAVKLWDVLTGKQKLALRSQTHRRPVSITFSPDGSQLASANESSRITLWHTHSGKELPPILSRQAVFSAVAFFPDGRRLLTANKESELQIWELATGRKLGTMTGHSGFIRCIGFSPNGRLLATGSYDRTVRIWSTISRRLVRTIKGHGAAVNSLVWSADGNDLFTGSADTTIKDWSMKVQEEPILPAEKVTSYLATAFSPATELMALGVTAGNETKLWNLSTGQEITRLDEAGDRVYGAAFSPDGKLLATGGKDHLVKLWDAATGRLLHVLRGHTAYVFALAFSPDGRLLVSGSKDQVLRLWDVADGRQLPPLQSDVESSYRAVFSRDGKYLASADRDGGVKLRDVSTWKVLRTFRGHTQKVTAIAFSPDGKWLVTGGDDSSVRLWNVATGQQVKQLGLADRMQRAVFSPDGKRLVTGGVEGTVKLWDMITGQELITLKHGFDEISSVTFSDDGLNLATSSTDGTVKLLRAAKEAKTPANELGKAAVFTLQARR